MKESGEFAWGEYIKDDNILRAANFILTLDNRAIQKHYQPYGYCWLDNLKKQVEFFRKQTSKEYGVLFSEATRAKMLRQSRTRLQQQTILMTSILIDDIQQQLINYLNDPTASVPTILNNERSS